MRRTIACNLYNLGFQAVSISGIIILSNLAENFLFYEYALKNILVLSISIFTRKRFGHENLQIVFQRRKTHVKI